MSVMFTLSAREVANLTYAWLVEGADQEARQRVDDLLAEPVDPRSQAARRTLLLQLGAL